MNLNFLDLIPGHDPGHLWGYACTNEEAMVHNDLIRATSRGRFNKAGTIASAGEVPILVLLPRCKEVICIDHTYRSLAAFWLKLALIERVGIQTFRHFLYSTKTSSVTGTEQMDYSLSKMFEEMYHPDAVKSMPKVLQKQVLWDLDKFKRQTISPRPIDSTQMNDLRREWLYIPTALINRAMKKLDKLTLIHGDLLKHLPSYGPFDILYTSNARDSSHTGKRVEGGAGSIKIDDYVPMMKPGGFLLDTEARPQDSKLPANLKHLMGHAGVRTTWIHHIYKRDDTLVLNNTPS